MNKKEINIFDKLYGNFDYILCVLIGVIILVPKMPFIPVPGIYFNIRIEDFVVAFVYALFLLGLLLRKIKIPKTSLHLPIFIFVFVIALSTLIGIIRDTVVSTTLGILYFMRYVEYIGLFFMMVSSFRKVNFKKYIGFLVVMYVGVIFYGILVRFNLAPMYRTMNSGGQKLYFYQLDFVQSTFGGHYDFGTYIMLSIPLLVSLFIVSSKKVYKVGLLLLIIISGYLMYYSYARSSYLGLIVALFFFFMLNKSKLFVIPALEGMRVMWSYFSGKFSKYTYDFNFSLGEKYSLNNILSLWKDKEERITEIASTNETTTSVMPTISEVTYQEVTSSGVEVTSSGKSLARGVNNELITNNEIPIGEEFHISLDPSGQIRFIRWQEHLDRFRESPLFGNGLSSIGVGADGDYIRWLTEIGLIGFLSFMYVLSKIFLVTWNLYRKIEDGFDKYIFLAFLVGFVGLLVNAIFIDVFEASKIAFYFWFITGLTFGYYHSYKISD